MKSSAGLVPHVRRAAVIRVPIWVASALGRASRGAVSEAGVYAGEFVTAERLYDVTVHRSPLNIGHAYSWH